MVKSDLDKIKDKLRKRKESPKPSEFLSTGSTLLDIALNGGFAKGTYHLLVGKSSSGKTWLGLTALAEASINPIFTDYQLIYDGPEDGARMDFTKFFGSSLAKRIKLRSSQTVEEFYYSLDDLTEPFVYVLDSESSLSSKDEKEKHQESKRAWKKGTQTTGSYGDGKAKKHSSHLRQVIGKLKETGSILLIVSQSRDNIGFGSQFEKETRGGGRALTFYATTELWFSRTKSLKRTVRGKQRKIGNIMQVKVRKNRESGREPIIPIHHYFSVGFDDIGACIRWLVTEKHWSQNKQGIISVPEWELDLKTENLISTIQEEGREKELREIVSKVWQEIDSACEVKRRNKYE